MVKKIDISILGLGNLGTAFFEGLRSNNSVNLNLYEENEETRRSLLELYDVEVFPNFKIIDSGILILCIKPQNIKNFFESFSSQISENTLICSPVAGLEIETINQYVKNRIIRIMPNLLIRDNNGLIPFVKNYDGDYLNFIDVALSSLGNTEEFEEELFALITAISGSGPAWFYELSNQLVNSATKLGMNEKDATNLIKGLIKALPNLINEEETFDELVNKVKSPKGTTEAGLNSLNVDYFDKIIFNAIQQATNRSIEISTELKNE
tara:strand:- start:323 stop:1120 length:798 start_codon:yes stop_codon:yes gene_type:complete